MIITMLSKMFPILEYVALLSVILFQLEPRIADSNNTVMRRIDEEREALLTFKQSLVDEYGVLSSWGKGNDKRDCCKWRGVRCSNKTGHVKVLNLRRSDDENSRGTVLKGTISPALLKLHDLRHLDLSNNHFGGSPLPEFIGSLSRLRYLNLSCGTSLLKVPRPFQYLSGLVYLRLENSNLFSLGSLQWLSHLSSLRHLDLSYINLTKSSDWFQVVAKLHSLKTLVLHSCALPPINPSSIWHFNLSTSFETLDLSDNNLPSSSIYPRLFNLSRNIQYLHLGFNSLQGSIPEAFQLMVSLRFLYLTSNELEGGIPKFFGNMCSLNRLCLPYNKLSGELSEMIQNLSGGCTMNSLEGVCLEGNDITGPLPDLGGFSSLKILILGENRLNGTIDKSLSQLLKLESLSLGRNSFTGKIPLGTQLQSFNASVYAGNPELCGLPLPNKCPDEESTPLPGRNDGANTLEDEDDQFMTLGFYVGLILGFFVGFWGVCGTLMLNRSWRHGYYNCLTGMKDWLYVTATLNIAKLQKFRN
ncbi:receptor-like protein EIX2 isoform X1 [Citrus sinensis]|uniref:receptor-like protein EIX2 isoform X1 n=1 Tax=Citrus sinensis TaxID=2711 RepID=UPI002278DAF5|nr:receptor-like protein EIX2 isoform X1 [Citrus sinensis]